MSAKKKKNKKNGANLPGVINNTNDTYFLRAPSHFHCVAFPLQLHKEQFLPQ